MADERVEGILDEVRASGGRATEAMRAVVRTLVTSREHLTADDIAASVQHELPDVHRSTIYRCLDRLEELAVVDHAHLGHGSAVFHLRDDRHHHLVCDVCGRVTELPDEAFARMAAAIRERYGFVLDPVHFALGGRCARCEDDA